MLMFFANVFYPIFNNNNNNNNNRYLYSTFSKAQSALRHFVGDLARLLFTGANCSHGVYNIIIVTVGFIGAPRTEESDRPPLYQLSQPVGGFILDPKTLRFPYCRSFFGQTTG